VTGRSAVIRADAHCLPLADSTVDLVVTSPPYLNLRVYTDGGATYPGQIGSEASREEFIDALLDVTRECVRVLKPTGSIFVNLGDSYRDKSLQLVPERYRIACTDRLGLIARAVILWAKPNGLPESVTDRVRRSHEDWVHLTKEPRYFSAVDEVREPHVKQPDKRPSALTHAPGQPRVNMDRTKHNPLGALPGSVWTIPTAPLQVPEHLGVDHFAAFPPEWPRRIILGWSPSGVCEACGDGRRPVTLTSLGVKERATPAYGAGNHGTGGSTLGSRGPSATITGYACACPDTTAPTRPAVVADVFGGTGTTAMVARALGRTGLSFDLSHDYSRLARWRTEDASQRAKVRGEDFRKPEPQVDGQDDLFGEWSA
jgi:DNA modification methylase